MRVEKSLYFIAVYFSIYLLRPKDIQPFKELIIDIIYLTYNPYSNFSTVVKTSFIILSLYGFMLITLPTKVHPVKAVVFPVVMYGCESWTVKKAEC